MNRNNIIGILIICALSMTYSCSHRMTKNMVGSDRDNHGCIASAGYCWSEARKDCIRLWEKGLLAQGDGGKLYVVFSQDSLLAEIFYDDGRVMCRKVAHNMYKWQSDDKSCISYDGRNITVSFRGHKYYGGR